jgi:hypothetical protein
VPATILAVFSTAPSGSMTCQSRSAVSSGRSGASRRRAASPSSFDSACHAGQASLLKTNQRGVAEKSARARSRSVFVFTDKTKTDSRGGPPLASFRPLTAEHLHGQRSSAAHELTP